MTARAGAAIADRAVKLRIRDGNATLIPDPWSLDSLMGQSHLSSPQLPPGCFVREKYTSVLLNNLGVCLL